MEKTQEELEREEFISNNDVELKNELKKIIDKKPIEECINYIEQTVEEQLSEATVSYEIFGYKDDILYQLNKAVKEIQGYSTLKSQDTMSKKGGISLESVQISKNEFVKVPSGVINVPGLGEDGQNGILEFIFRPKNSKRKRGEAYVGLFGNVEVIATVQNRYIPVIEKIIARTKELLKTDSIYGSKSITISEDYRISFNENYVLPPLIINQNVEFEVNVIKSRIKNTKTLKEKGIDIKYGVLLSGNYGTGKTLLAGHLQDEAVKSGWTSIYVKNGNNLDTVLEFINSISDSANGILLFVEDIDLFIKSGERDKMNEILNLIDGVDTKEMNLITIFTTNHIENIDPTVLRGKRIGAVINMTHLTKDKNLELINNLLNSNYKEEDLKVSLDLLNENEVVPAFVDEIVHKALINSEVLNEPVNDDMLSAIIYNSLTHIKLARVQSENKSSNTFNNLITSVIKDALKDGIEELRIEHVKMQNESNSIG
jgi:transitional endoplasmic reticulum ATPase